MSPAATDKPREVPAEGPRGGKQKVLVSKGPNNRIIVTWICGGTRTFSVEELRRQIEWLDNHGAKFDMWFHNPDSNSVRFWVRVEDGKLTANESMNPNGKVQWTDLKRALQATIAELAR